MVLKNMHIYTSFASGLLEPVHSVNVLNGLLSARPKYATHVTRVAGIVATANEYISYCVYHKSEGVSRVDEGGKHGLALLRVDRPPASDRTR